MSLKICEVFPSIQGEGPDMGKLVNFIRLGGCNKSCEFCDSKYSWTNWVTTPVIEVLDYIHRTGLTHIVFTGGEPFLQYPAMVKLINMLRDPGTSALTYHVAVETNGSLFEDPSPFDLVVVSPKEINDIRPWMGKTNVVFKLLVNEDNLEEQLTIASQLPPHRVYLMPMGVTPEEMIMGTQVLAAKMVEHRLEVTISPRLHILTGLK
jgi:organic radical activating enzyme